MNYEFFIAKRIIGSKAYKSSISAPIIKIGIAAIAIGIVVMMIAIATGVGLQQKIRDKVVAFNGHITITKYDSNNSQESIIPISKNQDFYPEFKSVEGVSHIQGVAAKFGIIRTATDFEGVYLKGVGADYNWSYFEDFLIEGELPDYSAKRNEDVLISQYLANRLQLKLNETFQMVFRKDDPEKLTNIITYQIVGIYNSGFQDFDANYIIGDIRHLQRINRWGDDQIGNFEVFINDYNKIDEKGVEIYKNIPSVLNSETIKHKYASVFDWIQIFDTNIYGIIGIMILVAGINMITALLVLILERSQMIGILKAIGSNNWSIRKLFLYNASYLILIGLLWGNIIGLGFLFVQKYFKIVTLPEETYYVAEAPVYLSFSYVLALNVGTLVLCLLMLLIPSYIITKISPVKAIRFQ
ncbi:FtsX-like permease family protein [Flavivirga abyssicola]|uniref:ABC transporter permease n=1 Tax=Flavivirga abyssicola TaxID=3063533 RepID=UPI0026DF9938|nr:FtsX-like permease family protein [Flavivirga sp. MEBiC07777]WVK12061.1 FtsX-like permease family protein [Flavivirga sp. MEBiC07777]